MHRTQHAVETRPAAPKLQMMLAQQKPSCSTVLRFQHGRCCPDVIISTLMIIYWPDADAPDRLHYFRVAFGSDKVPLFSSD